MPRAKKKKREGIPTEYEEHVELAKWLDTTGLYWWYTPNEGKHHIGYRMKQRRMGLRPGVADIIIPQETVWGHRGMALELKRIKGGTVSEAQEVFAERMRGLNWWVEIARGAQDAIIKIAFAYGLGDEHAVSIDN